MQRDVQVKRKAEVEPTAHSLLRFSQVSEPEIAEIDSASADLLKYKDLVKNALGEGDLWSTKPNPTFSYASASNLLVPHLSVETIKAKQLVLKCLLGDYLLKPQETLTRLEELLFACKLFDNSCWWRLSSRRDWDHGKKRYQSYESMIKGHLPTYQYMMGSPEGRVEALDDIDEFKKVISRFKIEKSPELKSFVDRMPRLIEAFKAYQERLEKVGIPRQPELVDILPRSISSKFSSNAEYCHAVDNEISDKGEEIENFRLEVQSLKQLINLAAFICKEGLKPLIVRGSGASMFKGAQHPFLVQKMGRSKVVPFSMRIDPKRQIIFFTGVNGCGKSKVVENIILNLILAQSCGFAYVENGVLG
ncbi:MAG: hypothetical protein KDD56_10700, partial [Bdellovibrionales bacterium]|nr:hypothetical protein [Bdellovibrionales bacterium]